MHIGFTGTQQGMTNKQKNLFEGLLVRYSQHDKLNSFCFHHGDCIGADSEAHDIVETYNLLFKNFIFCKIFIHPPKNPIKRAFKKGWGLYEEDEYIKRNHKIVDDSNILIAAPKEKEEQLRSGTWATIRYAKKQNKKIYILFPEGCWQIENKDAYPI